MRWFGFGFNAFGQICAGDKLTEGEGDAEKRVKVKEPKEVSGHVDGRDFCGVRASWSRRASLHVDGVGCLSLAGFTSSEGWVVSEAESRGCEDAIIGESHLILGFADRVESWDLEQSNTAPVWSMGLEPAAESRENPVNLPVVLGGYVTTKPPFYHPLSPQLKVRRVSVGAEHCVLLNATGTVYTWGLGSHGQLGHGGLTAEEEPRAVEALWGMPMNCVATGGWHTMCVSDGGDLYVWGWNNSGQLGLPSQALRKTQEHSHQKGETSPPLRDDPSEQASESDVFISIQAFPALLDVSPSCEIKSVSCGSRHTAAVTTTGDLYTWGWGEYGQLGYQASCSDEPQRVEFFREQQMCVVDVVCGAWNTFAAVVKDETAAT